MQEILKQFDQQTEITRVIMLLFMINKEAIFFNDANECYKKCVSFLKNNKKRKQVAHNGHIKVTKVLKSDYLSRAKAIMKKINIKNKL